MNVLKSFSHGLLQTGRWVLLLVPSLAAAYVLRLIWLLRIREISGEEQYNQFLSTSLLAASETLAVAIPILFALEVVRQRLPAALRRHILSGFGLLAALFLILITLRYVAGLGTPFSIQLLALLASSGAFAGWHLSGNLRGTFTRQVVFTQGTQIFTDAFFVAAAFFFSFLVRFDGWPPQHFANQLLLSWPLVTLLYLGINHLWGVYTFIWRLISLREAIIIAQSVASSALILLFVRSLIQDAWLQWRIPFGVLLIHPPIAFLFILGIRVMRRLHYRYLENRDGRLQSGRAMAKRLLLIGAGNTGARLSRELESRRDISIKGFLDDAPHTHRRRVNGIPVRGSIEELSLWLARLEVDEVVLCMPGATAAKRRQIVAQCETAGVTTTTVPSLSDIVTGKASITSRKPIRMEDLLGRDSVDCDFGPDARRRFKRRRILVTGAAGSIGSELARQLCALEPSELILLDKDENGLYEIGLEIGESFPGGLHPVIANIRDSNRLSQVFERFHPEIIFHAAAYKHVPMMERDPSEAILNNVIGTRNMCDFACRHEVGTFVLISTDKAVNPTSVMGASKRLAEMIVQRRRTQDCATRFCCVRFGNVLGSRASVVPIFQKRIAQGKSLKITHPEIRRFFMTIPEAVHLVIQAGSMGSSGEIFLLDMGDPVMIIDLARELIQLSGMVPEKDIPIEYVGLRKGEKLYEELLIDTERGDRSTGHPKIFVARSHDRHWPHLEGYLSNLKQAALDGDNEAIYSLLQMSGIGFRGDSSERPSLTLRN